MKVTLRTIPEENSQNGALLESLEKNAHKFYTTAPIHDNNPQPFEIIEKRLRDAYHKKAESKEVSEALFINSFPKQMVKSLSENDTNERLAKANEIQKNSRGLVEEFLSSSREDNEEKLGNVLKSSSELRETIPVTRRIELNRKSGDNSWARSVASSSESSKGRA